MKNQLYTLAFTVLLVAACGKSGHHEHQEDTESSDNPNQALYDQVMEVHDQVMPKSDQLYQLKKELEGKMEEKGLSDDQKKQFQSTAAALDSADHAMMDWMHHFKPLPDSANREAAREYLENEMEKIRKVKDLIDGSLQHAREVLGKK